MPSVKKPILLEVAVASVDDALAAQAGGANRLELNSALDLGGLTPSLGTLIEIKNAVALPVMVMIRPRPAGFCYSDHEFTTMLRDLDLVLRHGADGLVFGVLTADGRVDLERNQQLIRQCGTKEIVFHRAFDVTPDPFEALLQLIDLGFTRILTSGQEETALHGAALIGELITRAAGRIEILAGGGVNGDTVLDLIHRTGCSQVHGSFRRSQSDSSTKGRPQVSFGATSNGREDCYRVTDADAVANIVKQIR